jgi:hypothetical protein
VRATLPSSCDSFPHDPPKDAVYEPRGVVGGVPLRERDGFVDRALVRDLLAVELEQLSQADDAERALDVLTELAELSKAIEEELQRAKREAEADAES